MMLRGTHGLITNEESSCKQHLKLSIYLQNVLEIFLQETYLILFSNSGQEIFSLCLLKRAIF